MQTWSLLIFAFAALSVVGAFAALSWIVIRDGKLGNLRQDMRAALEDRLEGRDRLTLAELGEFEECLPRLREVIVVAHRVEDPQESLRAAVQDNFQEGVRYQFVVSNSQFHASSDKYEEFFRAIYTVAKAIPAKPGRELAIQQKRFDDLFALRSLRGEWGSWPYVFYRFNDTDGSVRTIAVRGDQLREGIAENYIQLSAIDALTIYNACLMCLDEQTGQIPDLEQDYEDAAGVVSLVRERQRRTGTV